MDEDGLGLTNTSISNAAGFVSLSAATASTAAAAATAGAAAVKRKLVAGAEHGLAPPRLSHCAPRSRHAPDKTTRMSSPLYLFHHHPHLQCQSCKHLLNCSRFFQYFVIAQLLASATVSARPDASYDESIYHSPPRHRQHQRRMVCNNGTDYQCICRTGDSPEKEPEINVIPCDEFIQSLELPVVDMRLRQVNLEAHLHTNEKYETYFKRRIANIVSSYCEHQANECRGTTLRLTQTSSDASQTGNGDEDNSVLYADDDETEPLLTQNNVVLLRVEREPANVTRILFAITKSENVGSLNEQMIIDPVKVKYILGSQVGPLARILGGIKLDSVRVSRIRRHVKIPESDNSRLITIISIVGAFFVICYIIGAIRLCRDARRRKRERKAATEDSNGLSNANAVPNYGSCLRKPSKNGAVNKLFEDNKQNYFSKYTEIDECVDNYTRDEPHVLTERQARFMFMCDPSQLPREPTFDSTTALDSELSQSVKSSPPREDEILEVKSKIALIEERRIPSSENIEPSPVIEADQSPPSNAECAGAEVPELVLVPSLSLESPITSDESPNIQAPSTTFLVEEPEIPFDRPKSRRGSRVGDEVLDLREVGGSPLGQESNNNFELRMQNLANDIGEERERREQELGRWSSSEGEVDVYYKLSDEEEMIRGDDWHNIKTTVMTPLTSSVDRHGISPAHCDSDSDEYEDEPYKREGDIDGYVYERLREELTPVPPDS